MSFQDLGKIRGAFLNIPEANGLSLWFLHQPHLALSNAG